MSAKQDCVDAARVAKDKVVDAEGKAMTRFQELLTLISNEQNPVTKAYLIAERQAIEAVLACTPAIKMTLTQLIHDSGFTP